MKRLILTGWLSLGALPWAGVAADAAYINPVYGVVTEPPVIDATNFVNYGQFSISTFRPFETFDTLNYTNYGTMLGAPGWRFEHTPAVLGARRWAATFINVNPGAIQAVDPITTGGLGTLPCLPTLYDPSYLLISATNIVVGAGTAAGGASLIVGANGELRLDGGVVDLSRSGLLVLPVWAEANGTLTTSDRTQYQPDVAVYDQYWVQDVFNNQYPLFSDGLWDGSLASAQGVPSPPCMPGPAPAFTLFFPVADSYINEDPRSVGVITLTNIIGTPDNVQGTELIQVRIATNLFKGAVFASAPPGFFIQEGFQRSREAFNYFNTAGVLLSVELTNSVAAQADTAYIRVLDTLASARAFRGLSTNILGCGGLTFRPVNYFVDRLPLPPGNAGNNGYPDPTFYTASGYGAIDCILYNTNVIVDTVTNTVHEGGDYAGYSPFFDNLLSRPQAVLGGNETNYPGRMRITAHVLDLSNSRLRAEGEIILEAAHLVSSSSAVVDCENLSFSLSSTNGTATIQSLVPETVQRLRGPIYLWSAVWSNQAIVVFTNNYIISNMAVEVPPGSGNYQTNEVGIPDPLTNYVSLQLATTMVNADALETVMPVTVFELKSRAPDVVLNDNLTVVRTFRLEGRSFTLNGELTFPGYFPPDPVTGLAPPEPAVDSWRAANAPELWYFTNHGTLTIASEAHFGDDRAVPYSAFVNTGAVSAASVAVNSSYLENRGALISQGGLFLSCGTGKFEGGNTSSGNITWLAGQNVKFNRCQLTANGTLFLAVTNALADAGSGAANVFRVYDGVQLLVKPATGDLLGTTLNSLAPAVPGVAVPHRWAAEDRGASAAGYENNAALGRLVLQSLSPNALLSFAGAGGQNALYVDLLDLSGLTNFLSQMRIAPDLVIYYAAARVSPVVVLPSNTSPEEFLDGQFGGRLRWVRTYAGPNSSQAVLIDGQTHLVNRALANSKLIDSDGDGVPNYWDVDGAFAAAPLRVQVNGNGQVLPNYDGRRLLVGQSYTVVAQPAPGATFTGWSGGVSTATPQLTFVMQSNLTLVASFTHTPVAATYHGLFYEDTGIRFLRSGFFTATTTTRGTYSGTLHLGKNRYALRGQFDSGGRATNTIPRKGDTTLTVRLQAGGDSLTGTVGDGTWLAVIEADRAGFDARLNPAPFAGQYTLVVPGQPGAGSPAGHGYGTATVDAAGKVKFSGSLADGTKLSQSVAATTDRQWPLFATLYSGQGQILGWLTFESIEDRDVGGLVRWTKQPGAAPRYYPAGFDLETKITGSAYNAGLNPITGFSRGTLALSGGNLPADIVNQITITNNKVTNLSSNKLSLSLNKSQGLFSGSVKDPATGKTISFKGALRQKARLGEGYFLGTDQSGSVRLAP